MSEIKLFAAGLLISSALCAPALAASAPQQCVTNAVAGGTSDAITVPLLPCGLATNILILTITANNTTTTPTLQMAGYPAMPIYTNTLAAPGIGDFGDAGSVLMLTSTGSSWLIINGNVGGYIPIPLVVADGGTGAATLAANGVLYGNGTSAVGVTAAGITGQVLSGNTGSAPTWTAISSSLVSSLSFGSTGLTPNSATTGAITVAGTLAAASGGTGLSSYTAGDLLYASGASALSKLAAGTSTQVLHGGAVPSWSAVGLTTDVTGTLPVTSGGTGQSSFTANGLLTGNGAGALGVVAPGTTGQILVGVTGADPVFTSVPASGVSTIGFGTTGLTPSAATGGVVTVAGTLAVANGGTGQSSYTDGQLLIGDSVGNTLTKASLTAGSGISITPGAGSITISAAGGSAIQSKTSNYNVVAGESYCNDTTAGAITATLPATPANNDLVEFLACSNYSTFNFIVARNGNNIQGLAENLTVNNNNAGFHLKFVTSYGWRLY